VQILVPIDLITGNHSSAFIFLVKPLRVWLKGETLEPDQFHWLELDDSTAQARAVE
jgi:hypothetical protein